MSGRRTGGSKAAVISFANTPDDGDSDLGLDAIIGKALQARGIGGRPPGAMSSKELRAKYKVSRTVMQAILKEQLAAGTLERLKITEYDEKTGRAKPNTVYVPCGLSRG